MKGWVKREQFGQAMVTDQSDGFTTSRAKEVNSTIKEWIHNICMSWFPGKAALLTVIPETCLFPLDGWPQELLSNGAKMRLEGNKLDKQFSSISEKALQQEEPIILNWSSTSEQKTWVRHLGMSTRDDKHCPFALESPLAPRFGNNLVICGNNPDISDNLVICDNLGIWGNPSVCGN